MSGNILRTIKFLVTNRRFWFGLGLFSVLVFTGVSFITAGQVTYVKGEEKVRGMVKSIEVPKIIPLDTVAYDRKMQELANYTFSTSTATSSTPQLWPVKTVYPNSGALLPDHRIIAYYGNLYSKGMGVLGKYPEDEMLARLQVEVKKWNDADPGTPAIPALHYIAVTAQGSKGADGKYRLRMPDSQIDEVLRMAAKINAIVFLDIQVGLSDLPSEVPLLEKYLKLPNVHLGIDPEFSMKTGARPGTVVGTFDAADINYTAKYLARIVQENNLTPKILVIHRYTGPMVTNYQNIKPLPEVQIVMHMDGWGGKAKKKNTYQRFVYSQPVQFAGFKVFYKHDVLEPGTTLLSPQELLTLTPRPVYIQYQ